ncbi:hypothetical protein V2J09_020431 [Rumex salicifolius]
MATDEYFFLFLLPAVIPLHPLLFLFAALLLHRCFFSRLFSSTRPGPEPAIPGPMNPIPILGLVAAFTGPIAHRVLADLAKAADAVPLMSFSIGSTRFIISGRPETAKEILNSPAFSDRPVKESAYELLFHRAMGFAPSGEYWRGLRRVSATHLFSPKRVAAFGGVRAEIAREMTYEIKGLMGQNGVVEVRKVLHLGALNNLMMTVFGKKYNFNGGLSGFQEMELLGLVREGYELLGMFNWSDHFPLLEDHKATRSSTQNSTNEENESSKDFVDVLLDLEGENRLDDSDIIAVLWEMIFRGTDTVAILLEWILARMVLHPDIQSKAQSEIDVVVGTRREVSDTDLPNLPYLTAVVKETLRMHPPGPLLSWARLAIHDTHVGPHFVPAGTTAMVNMWAITHDEAIWSNPNEFDPDRFVEKDVAIFGTDLRLAPFGAGRRVCPGKTMGLATVQLWLAQLLLDFKWVAGQTGVDLTENLKLSMEMKNSLVCKAIPRDGLLIFHTGLKNDGSLSRLHLTHVLYPCKQEREACMDA